MLTPFLFGGVLAGDEGYLLELAESFKSSQLSFHDFITSSQGFYAFHHIFWFGIIYVSASFIGLFTSSGFITQALLSAETVFASLMGAMLCHLFVARKMKLGTTLGIATSLAIFVGGFGIFAISMGGQVESYMVLIMAIRLFYFEGEITPTRARVLAVLDLLLVACKIYSLLFIVMMFPLYWQRAPRQSRLVYLAAFAGLILCFGLFKFWIWNPPPEYAQVFYLSVPDLLSHFVQQIISPWTGIFFCMPVMLVLFWHDREQRRALGIKLLALVSCMLFFSIYTFFDGYVPGGRYIFPFTLVLLPEIARAISNLVRERPQAAWLLPVIVLIFLPVGVYSFPFFSKSVIPSMGPCTPVHPAVYAWDVAIKKIMQDDEIVICYLGDKYKMTPRDVASPRIGPWRVAYVLSGGHSQAYREIVHKNGIQIERRSWEGTLVARLNSWGLGSQLIWQILGIFPGIVALWLAILMALRINRRPLTGSADKT